MDGNRYNDSKLKITDLGLANGSRIALKDSILLLVRGSILHQKIQVGIALRDVAFNQDVKALKVNTDVVEPWYLLFWFMANHEKLLGLVENTGIGAGKLDTTILQNLIVDVPPKEYRQQLLVFAKALDDKIELNRQINTTLESMAQALFKSWFVDFDPVIDNALAAGNPIPPELETRAEKRKQLQARNPAAPTPNPAGDDIAAGFHSNFLPAEIQQLFPSSFVFTEEMGWVPEGWDKGKLGDYVHVKRGGSPRPIHDFLVEEGLPWVKISDATSDSSRFLMNTKQFIKPEGLKKTVMLKAGELILSNSATPGLPKFLNIDACIHDGWLYFPVKTKFTDPYLYQLFLVVKEKLLAQGNGSVFTNLKTDILKSLSVIVPPTEIMEIATTLLDSFHNKSLLIQSNISVLQSLRDNLLPKLLSGQLQIPEAEQKLAEVL